MVAKVAKDPLEALTAAERLQERHLDTAEKCQNAGLAFLSLVWDAHSGGWGSHTQEVLGFLARAQRARGIWCAEGTSARMAQRISSAHVRATARAILRRVGSGKKGDSEMVAELDTGRPVPEEEEGEVDSSSEEEAEVEA